MKIVRRYGIKILSAFTSAITMLNLGQELYTLKIFFYNDTDVQ